MLGQLRPQILAAVGCRTAPALVPLASVLGVSPPPGGHLALDLADLRGGRIGLAGLRLWEASVTGASPALVIVSSGDRETTAAERFASPVLLDAEQRVASALGAGGTPMAVLVGPDGRLASPVAAGATSVMELLTPVAVP